MATQKETFYNGNFASRPRKLIQLLQNWVSKSINSDEKVPKSQLFSMQAFRAWRLFNVLFFVSNQNCTTIEQAISLSSSYEYVVLTRNIPAKKSRMKSIPWNDILVKKVILLSVYFSTNANQWCLFLQSSSERLHVTMLQKSTSCRHTVLQW